MPSRRSRLILFVAVLLLASLFLHFTEFNHQHLETALKGSIQAILNSDERQVVTFSMILMVFALFASQYLLKPELLVGKAFSPHSLRLASTPRRLDKHAKLFSRGILNARPF